MSPPNEVSEGTMKRAPYVCVSVRLSPPNEVSEGTMKQAPYMKRAPYNRSALLAGTYITHYVNYYPLVSLKISLVKSWRISSNYK